MRTKEYLCTHKDNLVYGDIVNDTVSNLLPLRGSREETEAYVYNHLFADIRHRHFCLRQGGKGVCLPLFEEIEGEVPRTIAARVRDELLKAVEGDGSFGYLQFILVHGLGQPQPDGAAPRQPSEGDILDCIIRQRDDYPKASLDCFVNEELNYRQYCTLRDGHYWDDRDELYLHYFNRVYAVYDELRLLKHNIIDVKAYLRGLQFEDDVWTYWTLAYIATLIEGSISLEPDPCLERCREEVLRITRRLEPHVVKDTEQAHPWKSPVHLSPKRGSLLNVIRIIQAMYLNGMLVDENGGKLTKKDLFAAAGKFLNTDLSSFDHHLSSSMTSSTALEKHLRIFDDMKDSIVRLDRKSVV